MEVSSYLSKTALFVFNFDARVKQANVFKELLKALVEVQL